MTTDNFTIVEMAIPRDRNTFNRMGRVLTDFELSHDSPIGTHFEVESGLMFYEFKSPGDGLYFGSQMKEVTPVRYSSGAQLRKIRAR